MQASDSEASQGPWTKLEACTLQTIESFLGVFTSVPVTAESVEKLYNFLANSEKAKELGLDLRTKSVNQIKGKMLQVLQTKTAFLNLFSSCLLCFAVRFTICITRYDQNKNPISLYKAVRN